MAPTSVIMLDRGNNTTCTVNLHGCTVVSWRVNNQEQLFVSKRSVFDGKRPIRGGVPLVFPFYNGNLSVHHTESGGGGDASSSSSSTSPSPISEHGFARIVQWRLDEGPERLPSGDIQAIFSLRHNERTLSVWNYEFQLSYRLILREKELHFNIGVFNPAKEIPFHFNLLFHTYLKCPDVRRCQISGFCGCTFIDRTRSGRHQHHHLSHPRHHQQSNSLLESQHYQQTPFHNNPQQQAHLQQAQSHHLPPSFGTHPNIHSPSPYSVMNSAQHLQHMNTHHPPQPVSLLYEQHQQFLSDALGSGSPSLASEASTTSQPPSYNMSPVSLMQQHSTTHLHHQSVPAPTFQECRELVTINEWTDRVYMQTPNEHVIGNVVAGRKMRLQKFNLSDTVIWNPWSELTRELPDFADDEYPNMISVQAGHISSPIPLPPGSAFEASQVLQVM